MVLIVGLGMGAAIEWANHSRRDRWAEAEAAKLGQAVRLYQRVAECGAADAQGSPYPGPDRQDRFEREWRGRPLSLNFSSWKGEGNMSLYWADRIYAESVGAKDQKLKFQRRLLLP